MSDYPKRPIRVEQSESVLDIIDATGTLALRMRLEPNYDQRVVDVVIQAINWHMGTESAIEITSSAQLRYPFTLSCVECDNGPNVKTPEQAATEGWIGIMEDPDGASWNYTGMCPDCQ
jgi:hypothetical protein